LLRYVRNEVPVTKKMLIERASKTKDKVLSIKLNEVASQLDEISKKSVINDNEINALMIAYEIIKELDS
jgi:hypothetical protein